MNTPETSLLGKVATYADRYDAALLYPLPRAAQRALIGVSDRPIFLGADLWTAYELSWLNSRGKPLVALGRFIVPSESTHLVESKSLKLYLGAFRNHGAFHEDCTIAIAKRLKTLLAPKWLRIAGYWYPRGGIPIDVFWQTARPPAGVWIPDTGVAPYRGRG